MVAVDIVGRVRLTLVVIMQIKVFSTVDVWIIMVGMRIAMSEGICRACY